VDGRLLGPVGLEVAMGPVEPHTPDVVSGQLVCRKYVQRNMELSTGKLFCSQWLT
jgi:hypothetical protein